MKLGYACKPEDEAFVAKATGKELRIKSKDAREICAAIQGMKAQAAVSYLEKVIEKKALVPYKKTKKHSGHKSEMKGWPYGRYPIKASKAILEVLKSAVSNAEFKGLNMESCVVKSAISQRGRKMTRMRPKGRYAVYNVHLTSVQIIIEEVSE